MSFRSFQSGMWRVGGGTAVVAAASSCFTSYVADRTGLEVSRRAIGHTQQRFQHNYLLSELRQKTTYSFSQPPKFSPFSTSNIKVEQAAATKVSEAAAAPSSVTKTQSRKTFVEFYEENLEKHPILTKMITGGILWSVGDAVAQIVPPMAVGDNKPLVYDWARTGRAAVFGFAIHAPSSHVHFNFLEYLTHRLGVTGLGIPVFKTIMEQFVYWSWISNSMYHGFMGLVQGMSISEIYTYVQSVLWDTQKAQWAFWIPVQLLNFQFVPVRHQLNVVLVTSIVWTALLSAWYPPIKEDDQAELKA